MTHELHASIEAAFEKPTSELGAEERAFFERFLTLLDRGELRAADRENGSWRTNEWIKKGILLGFRLGSITDYSINEQFSYLDKETFPLKTIPGTPERIRLVPGGSAVRKGVYLARGVIIMPPSYVNVGAYVDEETMVDSHVLIGSCAQIGRRVHLSAGTQIGGVLEPVTALPTIIEDDVLVGGQCGLYEGILVREQAVLGAGVTLTRSTPIYDVLSERILRANQDQPLEIPEGAVIVPGGRHLQTPFAHEHGLSIATPLLIKYRDQQTDARAALEDSLR